MSLGFHLWLIPLLPLAGAALNGLFGRRFSKRAVATVGLTFVGASCLWAWHIAWLFWHSPPSDLPFIGSYFAWIQAGGFVVDYSLYVDQLSLVMVLVVSTVGFLIHIYSVGYMAEEGGYYRYFAYLNLFMFFMLTLVMAENYLLMFIGWEGVGLASYLLIGFFFRRNSAAAAGMKAFLVNRIGDFGFLIALFLLIKYFGTLSFQELFYAIGELKPGAAALVPFTAIGLLLLMGACGKSAQLPLYVWLPDAMEGPTPVSALIHAATMVTAGVYMVARSHLIYDRAPDALLAVAIVGCLTALFAATIGMAQNDIKKVLAYSTISQLGYMFLACGVAAYSAGIFHLMTHAFFKGLLFLAAGSVIHAVGGNQDMRYMGGLRSRIPWTFWTMTAATLAIAGVPMFSGFFSKDEILWKAYSSPSGSWILWALGLLTAFLTAFYMFRLWFMTFFGDFRGAQAPEAHGHEPHVHESPKVMLVPLAILAVLSIVGGYVGWPGHSLFDKFLGEVFPAAAEAGEHAFSESLLMGLSVAAAALGIFLAWLLYHRRRDLPEKIAARLGGIYTAVANKYYVDEGYNAAFVQPVVEVARRILWRAIDQGTIDATAEDSARSAGIVSDAVRRMQSGNLRSYAGWVAAGAALVALYMIWLGVR